VLGRLCDRLVDAGVRVLSGMRFAASGHGCRDELAALLTQVKPRALLPVHGSARQLDATPHSPRSSGWQRCAAAMARS